MGPPSWETIDPDPGAFGIVAKSVEPPRVPPLMQCMIIMAGVVAVEEKSFGQREGVGAPPLGAPPLLPMQKGAPGGEETLRGLSVELGGP